MRKVTGVMFDYYFICKRKLWYFTNDITMEQENEDVMIGKIIDENSYGREDKHIYIDEAINIDFIRGKNELHEIKKSKSMEEADGWQLKYYLYYLHKLGIEGLTGVINYPELKQNVKVVLTEEDEKRIESILSDINEIVEMTSPPAVINSKLCKKCSYYELCYI